MKPSFAKEEYGAHHNGIAPMTGEISNGSTRIRTGGLVPWKLSPRRTRYVVNSKKGAKTLNAISAFRSAVSRKRASFTI